MERSMIEDNGKPENFAEYEYYVIERSGPMLDTLVRVAYDRERNWIGADRLDAGNVRFVDAFNLLVEAGESPYSTEITEEEFYTLCEEQVEHVKKRL